MTAQRGKNPNKETQVDRTFFDTYYEAISTADYVTLAECYDENVQLGSLGGTIHGRDEVLERIAEARTRVWPDPI